MAFETTATVLGAATQYRIAPEAKKYTLRDNGFTETNGGNFQLIRGLEATPQSKEGFKLKITVAKDLQTFKMSITTANGLKAVNIFKDEQHKMLQEKFYFLMDGFQPRVVCQSVSFCQKQLYRSKGKKCVTPPSRHGIDTLLLYLWRFLFIL